MTRKLGTSKRQASGPAEDPERSQRADPINAADYLEYLADVTLELSDMAKQADAATLAALMHVAYEEARLQLTLRKSSRG